MKCPECDSKWFVRTGQRESMGYQVRCWECGYVGTVSYKAGYWLSEVVAQTGRDA